MIRDDQKEGGSIVGSISSKNTTSLTQGPSMLSALESKQYVEKKNLFLCTKLIICRRSTIERQPISRQLQQLLDRDDAVQLWEERQGGFDKKRRVRTVNPTRASHRHRHVHKNDISKHERV
jgi:hypothetical protein